MIGLGILLCLLVCAGWAGIGWCLFSYDMHPDSWQYSVSMICCSIMVIMSFFLGILVNQ